MSSNKQSIVLGARSRVAILAAVLGALSLSATLPAQASDARVTVDFTDLNLSRAADVDTLYARLQRAADEVCQRNNGREHYQRRKYRECYAEAMERAVSGINAVQLTKLHAARDSAAPRGQRAS